MEALIVNETIQTPAIELNGDSGIFSFSGKSYPEDVNTFFKPVFDYLEKYKAQPCEKTVLVFKWLYYNTATSKIIVRIIRELQQIDGQLEIKWHYNKEATIIKEKGEELGEILEADLEIIENE